MQNRNILLQYHMWPLGKMGNILFWCLVLMIHPSISFYIAFLLPSCTQGSQKTIPAVIGKKERVDKFIAKPRKSASSLYTLTCLLNTSYIYDMASVLGQKDSFPLFCVWASSVLPPGSEAWGAEEGLTHLSDASRGAGDAAHVAARGLESGRSRCRDILWLLEVNDRRPRPCRLFLARHVVSRCRRFVNESGLS